WNNSVRMVWKVYMWKVLRLCSPVKLSSSFILFFFIAIISHPVHAQRTCGTPQAIKDAMAKYPARAARYQRLQLQTVSPNAIRKFSRSGAAVIPVVVHIVLPDPNQVTDAQVQSQINQLNIDYNAENP